MTNQGKNKEVPENERFVKAKGGRYAFFDMELKRKWNFLRRFLPEFKSKGEKEMSIVSSVWDKCFRFVEKSYWKVQLGFITWYALCVEGSKWEDRVLKLLKEIEFQKCVRRDTAIKVFGELADHFKLFRENDNGDIPWWVFSGCDCIFGYTDCSQSDKTDWQTDVLRKVIDWIKRRDPETYAGVPLTYDIEMSIEHFIKDFKPAMSKGYLIGYNSNTIYLDDQSERKDKEVEKEIETKIICDREEREAQNLVYGERDESFHVLSNYF